MQEQAFSKLRKKQAVYFVIYRYKIRPMKRTCLPFVLILLVHVSTAQPPANIDSLQNVLHTQQDTSRLSTLYSIARAYNKNGLQDSALVYFNKGLEYAREHGSKEQVAQMRWGLGESKSKLSRYDEALSDLFAVLKMFGKEEKNMFISRSKKEIGAIYIYQKKEKEALHYLQESETELTQLRDTMGLFALYANLPVCQAVLGDTVNAMISFRKGFAVAEGYDKSHPLEKAVTLRFKLAYTYNMVNFLRKEHDLQDALTRMEGYKTEALAGNNKYQLFYIAYNMADLSLRLKLYEKAQRYSEEALNLKVADNEYTSLMDIYWIAGRSSAALKQYEKAYGYLILHRQNADSAFKLSQVEAVNEVEAKYQVERKQEEINTLNKQKRAQRIITGLSIGSLLIALGLLVFMIRSKKLQKKIFAKEKELQRKELEQKMFSLEQTALRAQMNPHFIFNCLNSIQKYVIANDVNGVNHYLSTFASLVRQTLENSGKEAILLKDEIQYLQTYMQIEQMRSNQRFEYGITVDPGIDTSDTYVPNMIIQPFIENSIVHGITGAHGSIRLGFEKAEKLVCTVDDDGPGLRRVKEIQPAPESSHTPMGSSITAKRIETYNSLHEEKIELEILDKEGQSGAGPGTRVIIKFPL